MEGDADDGRRLVMQEAPFKEFGPERHAAYRGSRRLLPKGPQAMAACEGKVARPRPISSAPARRRLDVTRLPPYFHRSNIPHAPRKSIGCSNTMLAIPQ